MMSNEAGGEVVLCTFYFPPYNCLITHAFPTLEVLTARLRELGVPAKDIVKIEVSPLVP